MTQINSLSIQILDGELSYGGGIVRVRATEPSVPAGDFYWVPTTPIDVLPALPGTYSAGGDDGSGQRVFWPIRCRNGGCETCVKTPCIVPPKPPPPPPPPGHPHRPWIGFHRQLSYGPEIQVTAALGDTARGPLFVIRGAATAADVKAQVDTWTAGQDTSVHVYALDLAGHPQLASLLGSHVALPVGPVDWVDPTKTLASFFNAP